VISILLRYRVEPSLAFEQTAGLSNLQLAIYNHTCDILFKNKDDQSLADLSFTRRGGHPLQLISENGKGFVISVVKTGV
jgi:hypothetical protein